tara:strand:+ start:303 stop:638 length:336 start_codon:yes stop_codon:yes gene_type:complete
MKYGFITLPILLIATSSFAGEINLLCKDRNGLNTSEILLNTSANTASITNNGRVSHACSLTATSSIYMLSCPSFNNQPFVDRNSLQFVWTIMNSMKSTSDCEVVEKPKTKI